MMLGIKRVLAFFSKESKTAVVERKTVTMNFIEVNYSHLSDNKDYFEAMYNAEIDGIIVKGAVGNPNMEAVDPEKLKQKKIMVEHSDFGHVIGRTLNGCAASDLDTDYFSETAAMSDILSDFLQVEFEKKIESIFRKICGKRKVKQPRYNNGELYKASTVRCLETGKNKGMPVHIGQEFLNLPQTEHISSLVDNDSQLSFFFLMQKPERGGELEIFDLTWKDTPKHLVGGSNVTSIQKERETALGLHKSKIVEMEPGDLLIFDGGRIWHRVNPVMGSRDRITVGGFTALSKEHDTVYYWH